jgi:hypothetical protein
MRRLRHWLALGAMVALCGPNNAIADDGAALDAYEVGKLEDQLALDLTPVPVGMGALFIPSLTDPTLEPRVQVFSGAQRVALGSSGKRIVLPPGRYKVVFGQGELASRSSLDVDVLDGVTTPINAFFGAVRVTAVNPDGRPIAQRYTISTLDGSRRWDSQRTSDVADYAATPSWILPPGRYVLTLGTNTESREGRFVFVVHPGEVLRYQLVVEDDKLLRTEFAQKQLVVEPSIFKLEWVIGADLGLDRTARQLSTFNGDALRIGAFTRARVGIDTGNNLALLTVRLDESWVGLEAGAGRGLPLQKINDELNLELLYNYRLGGILGPYVRATGRTAFFDTEIYPDAPTTLITTNSAGEQATEQLGRGDTVRLMSGFYPLILQQGGGLGLSLLNNEYIEFNMRGGVAARQARYRNGRLITEVDGNVVNAILLDDKNLYGAEGTAELGLHFGGVFNYMTYLDVFIPQEQIFNGAERLPVYRWGNTVTLSVGRFAAIVYDGLLHRDDPQIEDLQFRHSLSLRLQHTLF